MPATIMDARIQPAPEMNAPGKARAVREMFAEIAPSYDRLNHLLSASIDKRWRRLAVRSLADVLATQNAIALDLCCGTGDLTIELANKARVIGCDFCHPMLAIGRQKIISHKTARATLAEADALRLPFSDGRFNAVTVAFGLRNLGHVRAQDFQACLLGQPLRDRHHGQQHGQRGERYQPENAWRNFAEVAEHQLVI